MRVGVVPYLNPESGGMHQYSLSVLDALAQLGELGDAPSIVLLVRAEDAGRERSLAPYPWPVMRLPGNGVYAARAAAERLLGGGAALDALAKAFVRGRGRRYRDPEALRRDPELARVLRDARLDWLFLTFPQRPRLRGRRALRDADPRPAAPPAARVPGGLGERRGELAATRRLLVQMIRGSAAIVAVPALLGILASPLIMRMYGAGFAEEWPTLAIALATTAIIAVQAPVGFVIAASGRMWTGFWMNLGWSVALLVLTWALVRQGAMGLALGRLGAYIIHSSWTFWFAYRVVAPPRGGDGDRSGKAAADLSGRAGCAGDATDS